MPHDQIVPSPGFEHTTPGLVDQQPNHYTTDSLIIVLITIYVK